MPVDAPSNIAKLLTGAYCRVLRAPFATSTPVANLADVIALIGAAAATSPFLDFGSTGDNTYSRGADSEGYHIKERGGDVLEDITEVNRTFEVVLNEVTPEHLQIVEQAGSITTIAAAANKSAQKVVKAGSIDEFDRHRIVFIARRKKSQAMVTEPGGATRGAYVAGVLQSAALVADDVEIEFSEGDLVSIPMQFKAYADPALPAGQDSIAWFEEQPGAIAAV